MLQDEIKYSEETLALAEKQQRTLEQYRQDQELQVQENRVRRLQAAKQEAIHELQFKDKDLHDQKEFEMYAKELIGQWQGTGRDIQPVLATLEKAQPNFVPRRRGECKQTLDTFSRLGFTVRWIPAQPVIE